MADNKNGTHKLKSLSFFSGAMGLDIGLEDAGIETILACEIDRASRDTIKKNRPDLPLLDDVSKYNAEEILNAINHQEFQLITGGPPCQAFSTAGKRRGFEDDRGNVFLDFINLIIELNPKYAVIENVRGLLSAPFNLKQSGLKKDIVKGGALLHIISLLEDAGYGISFNLYNSANYGAPQIRERVILVCSKDGNILPFIPPTHSNDASLGLKPWKTFKDAVGDLDTPENDLDFITFSEKRLQYYKLLKPGQNWRDLPEEIQEEAMGKSYKLGGGKTGFYRRLAWDKPSPTLVTSPAMPATSLVHPEKDRAISVQEYKRIQEFPDSWKIEGSVINQYKQIGNAVPVSLASALGNLIVDYDNGREIRRIPNFRYSRYRNSNHNSWAKKVLEDHPEIIQLQLDY